MIRGCDEMEKKKPPPSHEKWGEERALHRKVLENMHGEAAEAEDREEGPYGEETDTS
jgi:hypothetical protein